MKFFLFDRAWADSFDPKTPVSRKEFMLIFLSHYAVSIYVVLAVITGIWGIWVRHSWWQFLGSLALVAILYPTVEFCLHRFVLHGRYLYKSSLTSALWRRLHYDHHRDPSDMSVLIGAPYTTIPAILAITLPLGFLFDGLPGMLTMAFGGFIAVIIYELNHTAAHLQVNFKSATMAYMRRHHALHHFHNEQGNYGIVTNVVDKAVGTEYATAGEAPPSPTVRNLGYAGEEIEKYPWVAEQEQAAKAGN